MSPELKINNHKGDYKRGEKEVGFVTIHKERLEDYLFALWSWRVTKMVNSGSQFLK